MQQELGSTDLGVVQRSVVKHLLDDQAVAEGLDAQLGQQGGLRRAHLVASLDQVHIGCDLNTALVDLERGLGGVHAGVASRDGDVVGGHQAHAGGGSNLEVVTLGEDEAHVAHHVVEQLQPLVVAVEADGAAHHRVLAHHDLGVVADGLQVQTQRATVETQAVAVAAAAQ
ncbi:hypothetical protein ACK3TF_001395 [Chlorella vulgaris]